MAALKLEHPDTGKVRTAVTGFSVTSLFFGFIPLIFRQAWKWLLIYAGAFLALVIILTAIILIFDTSDKGIDQISRILGIGFNAGWASSINRLHLRDLLKNGYRIVDFGNTTPEVVSKFAGMDVGGVGQTASIFE